MEANWMSQGGFNFDFNAIPPTSATSTSAEPNNSTPSAADETTPTEPHFFADFDYLPDDMDLDLIFDELKKPVTQDKMISPQNQDPSNITAAATSTDLGSSILPTLSTNSEDSATSTHAQAIHQKKCAIAPSPYLDPSSYEYDSKTDIKPYVTAVPVNNQIKIFGSRKRKATISFPSVGQGYSSKKPRKYQLSDTTDPYIRNAIASKNNRDRKKKELQEMSARAKVAEEELEIDREENTALREAVDELRKDLKEKRLQNVITLGVNQQMATMKKALEAIIPALSKQFGRPMSLQVPDSFNFIPAVVGEAGELCIAETFNILEHGYQMNRREESTSEIKDNPNYFTLHINPHAGNIRLDYDLSKLKQTIEQQFRN